MDIEKKRDQDRIRQARRRAENPEAVRAINAASRARVAAANTPLPEGYTATCSACGELKPGSAFVRVRDRKSGHQAQCRTCRYQAQKAWNSANRGKVNESRKKSIAAGKTPKRRGSRGAKETKKIRKCAYKERVQHATPAWADMKKVRRIYAEARRRRADGEDVHVDHVIPLNHRLVCGLHVEFNLQVMPGPENIEKSNTFTM